MTATLAVVLVAGIGILGLIVGPFLGVLVDRVVEREGLAFEHRCCSCRAGLGSSSLIPVASWWQKCSECPKHPGRRYVLVDVSTALLFAAFAWKFGSSWQLWPYLALSAVLVALSAIDFETHLLPNIIVWPSIWVSLFLILVLSGTLGYAEGVYPALLGGALFGGFVGAASLVNEQGMGLGDVKLSLLLGLFIGWLDPSYWGAVRLVFYAIIISHLGGGLAGLAYNFVRKRGRVEVPFGPALAAGSVVIILVWPSAAVA